MLLFVLYCVFYPLTLWVIFWILQVIWVFFVVFPALGFAFNWKIIKWSLEEYKWRKCISFICRVLGVFFFFFFCFFCRVLGFFFFFFFDNYILHGWKQVDLWCIYLINSINNHNRKCVLYDHNIRMR